jgi:tetratricopeptide (TPR) repeat protein
MRLTSVLFACLLLQACASIPLNDAAHSLPPQRQLDVPFIAQQEYYCGPAALAEIAQFWGLTVDQQSLAKQLFIPGKKGSLAIEMQAAGRQLGLLPYPLSKNLSAILSEVNAGNPVLVFQNLGFSWWPQWHYAVVVGYDLSEEVLILHSGSRQDYQLPFRTFMATWGRTNYWARVLTDSSRLPDTAKPAQYIASANEFEQLGDLDRAMSFYTLAAEQWPNSKPVLTALANAALTQGDARLAVELFEKILQSHPDDPALWNNYAFALLKESCHDKALAAITKAVSLAEDKTPYQQSREEILASEPRQDQECTVVVKPRE